MDTIHGTFKKVPGISNAEARSVAKKLSKLDKVAIMIDEDKLATKADIAEARALTKADIAEVKVYIAESKADTDAKITKYREENKTFREENKTALANLKTDLTWRLVLLIGVVAGVTSAIIKIML